MDDAFSFGLDDFWRGKLDETLRWFLADKTAEARAEYLRVLHRFANLVLRGELPPPYE